MPLSPFFTISTATSTAWSRSCSLMPARMKHPLSRASGRSVDVRMQTAGNEWPTLVKNELSSGRVPESETTANAYICKQL